MQQTIEQVINKISTEAKPRPEMRIIKAMKPGQMIRQGDIYVINVTGMKSIKVFNTVEVKMESYTSQVKSNKQFYQLVPGSTMGSRHQVKSSEVTVTVNPTNDSSLVGPMIHAERGFELCHPEHAHMQVDVPGDYLVCYQLNSKTQQRVKD
jgi:hypothetical protein